jgi:hypothetical protein
MRGICQWPRVLDPAPCTASLPHSHHRHSNWCTCESWTMDICWSSWSNALKERGAVETAIPSRLILPSMSACLQSSVENWSIAKYVRTERRKFVFFVASLNFNIFLRTKLTDGQTMPKNILKCLVRFPL